MKQPLCVNRMCTLVPFCIVWYTKTECGIQTKENKMEKKKILPAVIAVVLMVLIIVGAVGVKFREGVD